MILAKVIVSSFCIMKGPAVHFSKLPKTFWAQKAIFEIQSLLSGGEVFNLETSAKWFIDLRFYYLAFKMNKNWFSLGKMAAHKTAIQAQKSLGVLKNAHQELLGMIFSLDEILVHHWVISIISVTVQMHSI